MKQANKKFPTIFYIGLTLLYLVVISSYLMGGLYAKYQTSSSSKDAAQIADFHVDIVSDINIYSELIDLGEMQPGDTKAFVFTVTNNSEIATAFHVNIVNLTGNLPLNVPLYDPTKVTEPIFSQVLQPKATATYSVFVSWDQNQSHPSAAGKTDLLELKVTAEQID